MLEVVREFARRELVKTIEYHRVREQHGKYFLGLCVHAGANLNGPGRSVWLGRLDNDHANLRAALYDARERDDVETGLSLAAAMWPFWLAHNYFDEARYWLDEFATRSAVHDPTEAKAYALLARADLLGIAENNEACLSVGREALDVARKAGLRNARRPHSCLSALPSAAEATTRLRISHLSNALTSAPGWKSGPY